MSDDKRQCQCLACLGYTVDAAPLRAWSEEAVASLPPLTLGQIRDALDNVYKAYDAYGKQDIKVP